MLHAAVFSTGKNSAITRDRRGWAVWARRRVVPLSLIGITVVTTLAFSLLWGPLVRHHSYWITPGDLWGTFRTAQLVGWGDIGDIYKSGGGLVTFPGISVALAPAALLVSHLGLSTSYPYGIAHPTAWFVLGPYQAVLGALVLVPLDALCERLGWSRRARVGAAIAGAVALWPTVVIWGHPEDSAAMAFALWGLMAALDHRWRAVGWWFGLAIAFQPLVVLVVPVVFALAPARQWLILVGKSVLPSAALLAVPLAQAPRATMTALLKQPNYPAIDHPTPWMALAPVLSKAHAVRLQHFGQQTLADADRFTATWAHTVAGETVAAGPGRLIAIGLALLLGVRAYRRRPADLGVVWLCCVALALRCVFEAVMNPYYLWPPIALAIVLSVREFRRFAPCLAAAGLMTWWSYRHTGPWEWWLPVVVLLAIVVASASPDLTRRTRRREPAAPCPVAEPVRSTVSITSRGVPVG